MKCFRPRVAIAFVRPGGYRHFALRRTERGLRGITTRPLPDRVRRSRHTHTAAQCCPWSCAPSQACMHTLSDRPHVVIAFRCVCIPTPANSTRRQDPTDAKRQSQAAPLWAFPDVVAAWHFNPCPRAFHPHLGRPGAVCTAELGSGRLLTAHLPGVLHHARQVVDDATAGDEPPQRGRVADVAHDHLGAQRGQARVGAAAEHAHTGMKNKRRG